MDERNIFLHALMITIKIPITHESSLFCTHPEGDASLLFAVCSVGRSTCFVIFLEALLSIMRNHIHQNSLWLSHNRPTNFAILLSYTKHGISHPQIGTSWWDSTSMLTGIQVMSHIWDKILRTYTFSRSTARAARNKVQVSYIKIIAIESVETWASWQTQLTNIEATRVGFSPGDSGLFHWVSYAFASTSKYIGFDPFSWTTAFVDNVSLARHW